MLQKSQEMFRTFFKYLPNDQSTGSPGDPESVLGLTHLLILTSLSLSPLSLPLSLSLSLSLSLLLTTGACATNYEQSPSAHESRAWESCTFQHVQAHVQHVCQVREWTDLLTKLISWISFWTSKRKDGHGPNYLVYTTGFIQMLWTGIFPLTPRRTQGQYEPCLWRGLHKLALQITCKMYTKL